MTTRSDTAALRTRCRSAWRWPGRDHCSRRSWGAAPSIVFLVLLVSAASHGLLDAMTNGGLGIAFFSPFSNRRYFLPWRVIEVSPLSIFEIFSWRGLRVLGSEVRYVWIPCVVFGLAGFAVRGLFGPI